MFLKGVAKNNKNIIGDLKYVVSEGIAGLSRCFRIFIFFVFYITKTRPCNLQQYFTDVKKSSFTDDFFLIFFLIFAQNIDCGYTLEPPQ